MGSVVRISLFLKENMEVNIMGNVSYSAADINTINSAADEALSTMNAKIAALEAIVANTGLRGTAGEQLQAQLNEAKAKMETAKEHDCLFYLLFQFSEFVLIVELVA